MSRTASQIAEIHDETSALQQTHFNFTDVQLTFHTSDREIEVLSGINLSVSRGETLCLVGASGCGKSTLLNIAAGFLMPTSGTAMFNGSTITKPGAARPMVFQEDATFPWYTVRENISYGLRLQKLSRVQQNARVDEMLNLVGLSDFGAAYPGQLSGGMRKRCDMARSLALAPPSILMDEPFAALDVMTKERLQVEFRSITAKSSMTSLFVTHDLEEALFVGDRVAVMRKGAGPFLEVLDVPFGPNRDVRIKTDPEFQSIRRDLADLIAFDAPGSHSASVNGGDDSHV